MDRSINKKIGTNYLQLDTPSLVLDIDAFKFNLDTINFKLNSIDLSVRIDVNSHLSKDILNLQLNGFSNALGISSSNVGQASIFSQMTDDILIDSPIISSDKLDSLININAKCAYNSLVQLQAVDHSKLSGVYIKIFEGEIDEFDSNILSYIIENKIKINGIIVEFSNYKSKKDNVVSKFIESYPELNKITNNFILNYRLNHYFIIINITIIIIF